VPEVLIERLLVHESPERCEADVAVRGIGSKRLGISPDVAKAIAAKARATVEAEEDADLGAVSTPRYIRSTGFPVRWWLPSLNA
jgi:hypothetical protein